MCINQVSKETASRGLPRGEQVCIHNESTKVQNPRRNSYTQTMDVCITPCTVDISVDSPALFVG